MSPKPRFLWLNQEEWQNRFSDQGAAKADLDTGEIFLSEKVIKPLPRSWQLWIMAHEEAHIRMQTMDEYQADQWAFYKWVEYGYPLSDCVYALTRVLNTDPNEPDYNPEHEDRLNAHVQRLRTYDYLINENSSMAELIGR